MKKILLAILCLFLLTSCNKNENQNLANDNSNVNNNIETEQEEQKLEENEILYTGSNENFNVRMKISKFTKGDLENLKNEYGADSDTYLRMQDDMPSYKLETFVNYVGDPVDGIEEVENMTFNTKIDSETIGNEENGNQEVIQALQGAKNITPDKYYYSDEKRGKLPTEDSTIIVKSGSNSIDKLNFEIELKEEK